jgi:hypothetical protein
MKIRDFSGNQKLAAARFVLFGIFIVLVTGCTAVLLPQARFFIISLAKNTMTHYSFTIGDFDDVMLKMARAGIVMCIALFVIALQLRRIVKFFAENYAVARYLLILPVVFGFVIVTLFGVNIIVCR